MDSPIPQTPHLLNVGARHRGQALFARVQSGDVP